MWEREGRGRGEIGGRQESIESIESIEGRNLSNVQIIH